MKQFCLFVFVLLSAWACQIEDENAPTPDESFIKHFGELTGYNASDIEFLYDSAGFIIFAGVTSIEDGRNDYALIKVDQNGTFIDSLNIQLGVPITEDLNANGDFSDDFLQGDDLAASVEVFSEGFAFAGTTTLNDNNLNIQDVNVAIIGLFDTDFNPLIDTVFALFAGDPQSGLDYFAADIIRTQDGGFLFGGSVEIDRTPLQNGGITDFDYQITKFSIDNGIEFVETIGVEGPQQDDRLVRIFEKNNGNFVLIGYSPDESALGENGGNNGLNVNFTEVNASGKVIHSVSYGLDNPDPADPTVFDEIVHDAIRIPSGFAIVGTSVLSSGESYAFFMNLGRSGSLIAGDTLSSAYRRNTASDPVSIQTQGLGIVQTLKNDFVILGKYPNFSFDLNINDPSIAPISRAEEAMFMKISPFGMPVPNAENSFGSTNGNDAMIDALLLPDGKIIGLANIDFGGGIQLISLIKLNDTGNLVD